MNADRKNKFERSATIPAIVLFAVLCITTHFTLRSLCKPTKVESYVEQLKHTTQNPDVVLLGSSYIYWPLGQMITTSEPDLDVTFRKEALDSASLADGLKIYNLTYAYQLVSDNFVWVDQFLIDKNKPACVVLGVAPRDFLSSDYSSPVLTDNFISTVQWRNVPEYVSITRPPFEDLLISLFSKSVPFYHKRVCLKTKLTENATSLFKSLGFASKENSSPHINIWTAPKSEIWNESLREYRYHYSYINTAKEELQFAFLERLLQTCKKRNIKALIVNMPARIENLNLLPTGYYDHYCQRLQRTTLDNQGEFIDLNKDPGFVLSDFDDTIHLNSAGGKRLFSAIFSYLQQHALKAE